MKKRVLALLCIATMAIVAMAGCGKSEEPKDQKPPVEEQTAAFPVTVTDQVGREVTIEKEPKSLVSGYYISTSMLIALGQEDKMVGVEAKADTRSIYALAAPELVELPSVGTAKEFNLEVCANLNPDLVVLPAKLKDVVPSLEELGITVLCVKPEDQEMLEEAFEILGKATGSTERANALLSYTDEKLAEAETILKDLETPNVYLASNSSFLATAGAGMYQDTLITNAGGANVAKEITANDWAEIDYEQLLAWNPNYIILAADAKYDVDSVLNDSVLAECDAVVNKQVYQFPSDIEAWDSPVPSSVLGNLWLASVLHPQEYSVDMYQAAVVEFYETFYGFTPVL